MAEIITFDEIDFAKYEKETDHQQKIRPASLYIEQLIDRLRNPVREKRAVMPWRKTHAQVQFRPGEVTIWGGANGQGKSLVTGQVALSLCAQGERVGLASFEMKPMKTLERMARQYSTHNVNDPAWQGSPEAIEEFIKTYEEFRDWTVGRLWLYDHQGTITGAQAAAVVRYCAKERGITHFFVDSLMKCVAHEDDYNGQKQFVDEMTSIARDNSIHIHIIHHIKKPPSEDHKPTKYDYKGTGAITDLADNVVSVWRNKVKEKARQDGKKFNESEPDAILICDKQRNGEWEGNIGLWFDRTSQQYVSHHGEEPMRMELHPED